MPTQRGAGASATELHSQPLKQGWGCGLRMLLRAAVNTQKHQPTTLTSGRNAKPTTFQSAAPESLRDCNVRVYTTDCSEATV